MFVNRCLAAVVGVWQRVANGLGPKAAVVLIGLALAGCASQDGAGLTADGTRTDSPTSFSQLLRTGSTVKKSDLVLAQESFDRGAYGLAEKHYRKAIEGDRQNAEAWLGLAASYDQLRRYDLADKAYAEVKSMLGDDPAVLNNLGYSQILRGDYAKARRLLLRARRKAPDDRKIAQNIAFLNRKQAEAGRKH